MIENEEAGSPAEESQEGENQNANPKSASQVPRIPIGAGLDIDVVREQLENFGRVVIVKEAGIYVPDRSVSLLTRALRVPRVPRTSGPTHFTIPRHIDRCGTLLASTEQWDPINWRTRAARPSGSQALLLAKPILRHLPESGKFTWTQLEECLCGIGVNGVYEPLAMAIIPQGDSKSPRQELFSPAGGGKVRNRLVDTVASVFKRGSSEAAPVVTEETKARWNEKAAALPLTKPYIIVSPFGTPTEGVHDWAVERCAEVLRHALEWRGVESVIVCTSADKGKAERLRIISGSNVSHIVCDLATDEVHAAIANSKGCLATPGSILVASYQLGVPTVCIAGPASEESADSGAHLTIRAQGQEPKNIAQVIGVEEHGCLEGLDAGPVARALSKVLAVQAQQ